MKSEFIYHDKTCSPALKVQRTDFEGGKKRFAQFHLNNGDWKPGRAKVEIQPYKYIDWKDKDYVFLTEGEKCVQALEKIGAHATTIPGGANAWKQEYVNYFEGKKVILLPDNDEPGRRLVSTIYTDIKSSCSDVKILELPGLNNKEDVYDWISKGGTKDKLFDLCKSLGSAFEVISSWNNLEMGESSIYLELAKWPYLREEAFQGLAGDIVRKIEPHTESSTAALLIQFLVTFGSIIGKNSYYKVEATKHYTNLFAVIVGASSKARKGTSLGQVMRVFEFLEDDCFSKRVQKGLSSGEGLVEAVKDHSEKIVNGSPVIDHGVKDKRLLLIESEWCSVLDSFARPGNTLSARLRDAWDHGNFQTLTKGNPISATGAHISNIGHITIQELKSKLSATDMANGLGNRYLFFCAQRSKNLAHGGAIETVDFSKEVIRLKSAIEISSQPNRVNWDEESRLGWSAAYNELVEPKYSGLLGSITSRGEAQVVRLATIYALLDCSLEIEVKHLKAALAVWEYSEDSCKYIFAENSGDPLAEEILANLKKSICGMTRTQIMKLFNNHKSKKEIDHSLGVLARLKLVEKDCRPTAGRNVEVWKFRS